MVKYVNRIHNHGTSKSYNILVSTANKSITKKSLLFDGYLKNK